ncbi:hypothetical protein V1506DRAFT_546291 [Lipomyces tetrasporus]
MTCFNEIVFGFLSSGWPLVQIWPSTMSFYFTIHTSRTPENLSESRLVRYASHLVYKERNYYTTFMMISLLLALFAYTSYCCEAFLINTTATLEKSTPFDSNGVSYEYNLTAGVIYKYDDQTYIDADYVDSGITRRAWVISAYAVRINSTGFAAAQLYHPIADATTQLMEVNTTSLVNMYASYAYDLNMTCDTLSDQVIHDVAYVTSISVGTYGSSIGFDNYVSGLVGLSSSSNLTTMCDTLNSMYNEDDAESDLAKRWTITGQIACHGNHGATNIDCYSAATSIPYDGSSGDLKIAYVRGECAAVRYRTYYNQNWNYHGYKSDAVEIVASCWAGSYSAKKSGVVQATSTNAKVCVCNTKNINACYN